MIRTFLIFAFVLIASRAQAQLRVMAVISGGTGCPFGSVNVTLSPDGSAFTVLYDQLSAQVSPASPNAAVACEVTINIRKPLLAGFSVEAADFRGFVSLQPGVAAEQRVSVASGSVKELRNAFADFGRQSFVGPVEQNYVVSTVHPVNGARIFNCIPPRENTKIVIKTQIFLSGAGNGLMAVDSVDGRMSQTYHLRWQNCAQDIGGVIGGIIGALGGGRR